MAKFAPVAPIQVLEGLYSAGHEVFGDYHLLLAHHTVEHAARFTDLFNRAHEEGWQGTIIMDNSIVELGGSVDLDMIGQAVKAVSADYSTKSKVYPVLPDVMGDGKATRAAVWEAYLEWEAAFKEGILGEGMMVVCQGKNFQDYVTSLKTFGNKEEFPEIKVLGIPRVLVETAGSRVKASMMAKPYTETHWIHLLGFSDYITDDLDAAKILQEACGIDSAVPLRVREAFGEFTDAGKRPSDWFETAQFDILMKQNLDAARKMFA